MLIEESKNQLIENKVRLSEAFPPKSINNFDYIADCHFLLQSYGIDNIKPSDITFRPIKYKADINQLKKLHQEWFPINYSQDYYDQIFKNASCSLVAEVKLTYPSGRKENILVGSMVYRTKFIKTSMMQYSLKDDWKELLAAYFTHTTKFGVYIMTLGVVNELRGKGIAQNMLEHLKDKISDKIDATYIYLDMVTYNNAAARFYEKNDFIRLMTKKQHYDIEGQQYDSYVYVWYKDETKRRMARQIKKLSLFQKCYDLPVRYLSFLRDKICQLCSSKKQFLSH